MSNAKSILSGLAIFTVAALAVVGENMQREERSNALQNIAGKMEARLQDLKNKGADRGFFTRDLYAKAEKAFYSFKLNETEEHAYACMEAIQACEKKLEFFGV